MSGKIWRMIQGVIHTTIEEAKAKLIAWCNAQIGTREGSNNWNKYASDPRLTQLYGWNPQNQPWCDIFTDAAFISCFGLKIGAAMTYQQIGSGSALCRTSASYFKENNAWYHSPEPGDVIFFFASGDINHQGIVTAVSGNTITTVEGNSSDMVARRIYTIGSSQIAGYGRPKWSLAAQDQSAELTPSSGSASSENAQITTLKKGMIGEDVKALQKRLISLGYSCGPDGADGEYGNNTMKAVTQFQEDHNLTVTGEVDAKTLAALNNANENEDDPAEEPKNEDATHTWKPPTLNESNAYSSSCVVLQGLLNVRHFPCGTVDGFFGDKTKNAVNAAKAFYGLKLNGVCDKSLWIKLLST